MKNKIAVLIAAVLLVSLMSTGCVDNDDDDIEFIIVTDMDGREVRVPTEIKGIVAHGSGCMRLIAYMGATDLLVGVEEFEHRAPTGRPYRLANPQLADLPSVGPIHGGDMELIVAAEPCVIFRASTAPEADDYQDRTGIPTISLEIGDLDENREGFYGSLRLVGEVLGKEERAEDIIDYIDSLIADLDERTKTIPDQGKPSVYVGGVLARGTHPLTSTYGKFAPFTFTHSINVAGQLGGDHPITGSTMVDKEQIIAWDPDIIFVDMGSYTAGTTTLDDPEWQVLQAFENGELYGILPYNYHHINYGTVLANSYYVGSVLYPDEFADIDVETKADEIYQMLVGAPVYEIMERDLGGFGVIEP